MIGGGVKALVVLNDNPTDAAPGAALPSGLDFLAVIDSRADRHGEGRPRRSARRRLLGEGRHDRLAPTAACCA